MELDDYENFSLSYEEDCEILLHRDCHFAGRFSIMLDYYRQKGVGVREEISINRIEELADYENRIQKNIAPLLLTESDAEKVVQVREVYRKLREICQTNPSKKSYPHLIADLILTEEEEPIQEMEAIAREKTAIVPALVDLIQNEDFYDPLFPGYGLAPSHALLCLQKIGDKNSIIALFESIGAHGFFQEDVAISALHHIGKPAKDFLLRVLQSHPLTYDNERAAIALLSFENDVEVARACWKILGEIDISKNSIFTEYLLLGCQGLQEDSEREAFKALVQQETFPRSLKGSVQSILKVWATEKRREI